jgi:preprotein translocase subunit SecG
MSTVETILMSLLVLDAIALTVLVMLQQGKGADVGAAFGSGSSNTMFGSVGTTSFLTKATAWLAIGFFAIAFGLAALAKQRADSVNMLGIPTVSEPTIEQLTAPEERVDSNAGATDVPVLDDQDAAGGAGAEDAPGGDIPEL